MNIKSKGDHVGKCALERGMRHKLCLAVLTFLLLGMLCGAAIPVRAAATTYTVGTLSDSGAAVLDCAIAANTDCSLRNAIAIAQSGADTIQFRAGLAGAIMLDATQGSLILTAPVTIAGPGAASLAVDGGFSGGAAGVTVFAVNAGVVATIRGLTIRHGKGTVVVNGDGGDGGGIFNRGALSVDQCVINANTAGIAATNGSGGGIYNTGTLTVTNSTISGNSVGNGGNGGNGGGIANHGALTLNASNLTGNQTSDVGSDASLSGNGGGIFSDGTMSITASTIANNSASASYGGGIDSTIRGTLTMTTSTVDHNSAGINGGGITVDGTGSIARSTISNNIAANSGGGIASYGTVTVATSTISHNTATHSGGGIWSNTRVVMMNSTVAKNRAAQGGGLAINYGGATLGTTLVGTNTAGTGPDIMGTISNDNDYNLLGVSAGVSGLSGSHDVVNHDPLIDDLADNGGATQTHALQNHSPAFNAGGMACAEIDQRGTPRPQAGACDIGAFEALLNVIPVRHADATLSGGAKPLPAPAVHAPATPQTGQSSTPAPAPQPPRH